MNHAGVFFSRKMPVKGSPHGVGNVGEMENVPWEWPERDRAAHGIFFV